MKMYILKDGEDRIIASVKGLDEESCYEKAADAGYLEYPYIWLFAHELPSVNHSLIS